MLGQLAFPVGEGVYLEGQLMAHRYFRRFGWFSEAYVGWQNDAKLRLQDVIARYGLSDAATSYIQLRIRRAPLTSFERRRWRHIRKLYWDRVHRPTSKVVGKD
ncbi:hypothetical protein [Sphingobium sp. CFD-2]|uniref:hypothetical protein n=1 Tax=Sphingobium sp. CFD-2 TaxID=2878542 RepID=UPI00214C2740|nr:hypothetical protein [Sphingobium sp. CFD-2]